MHTGPVGFDLDMTLINSRPAILASFAAVARQTGVPIDLAQADARLGIKLEDEFAHWFPPDEIAAASAMYRQHYVNLAAGNTEALPGAVAALAAVRTNGQRAVIVTAKHQVSVEPSLRASRLSADEVYTSVYGLEKAEVLTRIGASVYVGDTPSDVAAALAAGAVAVAVPTGSFDAAELRAAGAQVVLGSLTEFPEWYSR